MRDFDTYCLYCSDGEPKSSVLLGNYEYLFEKKKKRKKICWTVHKDLVNLLVRCLFSRLEVQVFRAGNQ